MTDDPLTAVRVRATRRADVPTDGRLRVDEGMERIVMSIRLIARDLYRLEREVEQLEKEIAEASPEKQAELEDRLRKGKSERDRMRRILEGSKGEAVCRKPL